jgi:crotonobetainyl-CoA hydratase
MNTAGASPMEGFRLCRVTRDGPILTVVIDRPEVLNALDPEAHAEMARAFDLFAGDPALRVAVVTGSGSRAFCVGSDLKARARTNRDDHPATGFAGLTRRFDLAKPVIAAVNGMALGGGAEIVLACDLAVAADHAEFGLPEPRAGLAALGGGGLQRLARQLPLKQAMALALTGRRITAEEARRIGLVNEVVPAAGLAAAVRGLCDDILAGAPLAVEATKQVMLQSLAHPGLAAAIDARYPAAERMLASEDAKEGQRAFAEKRKPVWKGR